MAAAAVPREVESEACTATAVVKVGTAMVKVKISELMSSSSGTSWGDGRYSETRGLTSFY